MAGPITISLEGTSGTGLHYAARVIADALGREGAEVDTTGILHREELAPSILQGSKVQVRLTSSAATSGLPSNLVLAARIVAGVFVALMVAGAEIRLHFAPSFDLVLMLGCLWLFWNVTKRRNQAV